jgi:Flp pilus assembly protein TadD
MGSGAATKHGQRLSRLLSYLDKDPVNSALLADAAQAAFDEGAHDQAVELIGRHPAPLPPQLLNLEGLIALAQNRDADASAIFEALRRGNDTPALRVNLAWTRARDNKWEEVLALLDDAALDASPHAPALKIHALHHLDRYDDGLAEGEKLAARYPANSELLGALATLALDAERLDLVKQYATGGKDSAEGQTALGMLSLEAQDAAGSLALFEQAMQRQPNNPRAWLGKGLAQMATGDSRSGSAAIDCAAELFGTHPGSWVASGWAHFVNGDTAKARAAFSRALAVDDTFAESHGGMAAVALAEDRLDEARKECEIALRLDKNCFGGALTKSLLLERAGHGTAARRIRDAAMNAPIGGPGGKTILQALAGFGKTAPR